MMFHKKRKLIAQQIKEIKTQLMTQDEWSFVIEWGVGKETYIKISKSTKNKSWYDVWVELDHQFHCLCPTIERAVEFADIYSDLIYNLYMSHGWPSWHSKTSL
jgi:hypothetical protein